MGHGRGAGIQGGIYLLSDEAYRELCTGSYIRQDQTWSATCVQGHSPAKHRQRQGSPAKKRESSILACSQESCADTVGYNFSSEA